MPDFAYRIDVVPESIMYFGMRNLCPSKWKGIAKERRRAKCVGQKYAALGGSCWPDFPDLNQLEVPESIMYLGNSAGQTTPP